LDLEAHRDLPGPAAGDDGVEHLDDALRPTALFGPQQDLELASLPEGVPVEPRDFRREGAQRLVSGLGYEEPIQVDPAVLRHVGDCFARAEELVARRRVPAASEQEQGRQGEGRGKAHGSMPMVPARRDLAKRKAA
jgi:hypothetical protein